MEDQKINLVRIIFLTASIIILFAVFIIYIIYYYQKKHFIFYTEMESIKIQYEKNIMAAQLEIQEQTFRQISSEIHDSISLSLTLSKLHLSTINFPKPVFRHEKIDASICLIGDAIQKLNNISRSLNSDLIKENGLISAIENETSLITNTGLCHVNFQTNGTPVYLDSPKELLLFRIIQEGLNNILKHSKASQVHLIFDYRIKDLIVSLKDNGIGFDIHSQKKGSGTTNIRQRTSLLNGTCDFISCPNKGTTILLKIPFK